MLLYCVCFEAIPEGISGRANSEGPNEIATNVGPLFGWLFYTECSKMINIQILLTTVHNLWVGIRWIVQSTLEPRYPSIKWSYHRKNPTKHKRFVRERLIETSKTKGSSLEAAVSLWSTSQLEGHKSCCNWLNICRFTAPIRVRFWPKKQARTPETHILYKSLLFGSETPKKYNIFRSPVGNQNRVLWPLRVCSQSDFDYWDLLSWPAALGCS